MLETVRRIEAKVDAVDKKVSYTNGKVRKITIALVALGFFCLGMGLTQPELLKVLLAII